jgi:tRNA G18 (ribose-2'-O)-methylase SpoU
MGALFAQKLVRTNAREFAAWSTSACSGEVDPVRRQEHAPHKESSRRLTLIGSSPAASRSYRAVRYRKPVVIAVGGERRGLSQELIDACSCLVSIPMTGSGVDSLNVAVAAGILLYEVLDQSRRH